MNTEYYDNDWDAVSSTPSQKFVSPPIQAVLDRASSWELPKQYACVVRVQNPETFKIQERVFKQPKSAQKFVDRFEEDGWLVTAYTNESLYSSAGFPAGHDDYDE